MVVDLKGSRIALMPTQSVILNESGARDSMWGKKRPPHNKRWFLSQRPVRSPMPKKPHPKRVCPQCQKDMRRAKRTEMTPFCSETCINTFWKERYEHGSQ